MTNGKHKAWKEAGPLRSRIVGEGAEAPDQLLANPLNWRTHPKEQVDALEGLLREVGWVQRVIVNRTTGHIVDGHARVELALRRSEPAVPVLYVELTEAEERLVLAALDPIGGLAGKDAAVLDELLQGVHTEDPALQALLDSLSGESAAASGTDGLTDPDDAPEVQADPVTKLGDVWVMGEHRVMCGDSTSIDDVMKVMAGGLADVVFTDPPYNVAYEGRGEVNKLGPIKNDSMSDEQFEAFCREFFACYFAAMKPSACIYVCHPDGKSGPKMAFEKTFSEHFRRSSTIIWVKQSAVMGWQDYRAQHEPILYGWKDGAGKHFFCGDRTKTTVWEVGRDAQSSYVHPTQKPVALPSEAILNSSKAADIVLDLFGGSGSTLIAAEKNGRIARLMELDPRYCDVIVRRWQAFTGQAATLEGDGRTFDEIEAQRAPADA